MRSLRWVGFLSSLLIGGVLMAPVPSEASGVHVYVNGGEVTVYGPTCSSADRTAGYTSCWALLPLSTTPPISFNNVIYGNVSSTNPARLLIADTTGAGNSLDLMTLTGVTLKPTTSASSTNIVNFNISYVNTFDDAPNTGSTYLIAMRAGGYFVASDGSVYKDQLTVSETGIFPTGPSGTINLGGISTGPIGNTTASASFNLASTQPYVEIACASPCSPTITETMTIHVELGTDTVYVTNSGHHVMGTCREIGPPPTDTTTDPITTVPPGTPNPLPPSNPCKATAGKISSVLTSTGNMDQKSANAAGAPPYFACVDDPETEGDDCFIDEGGDDEILLQ